jgi:MFS family permease
MAGVQLTATSQPTETREITRAPATASLWRDGDFMKLWGSETLSQLGSQVSAIALPMAAIVVLHASAKDIGLLAAVQYAPLIGVPLVAGSWVERHRRRPVLVTTNAVRAVLMGLVPALYAFHQLTMGILVAIAFTTGLLTVFFDVTYLSYLPQLVDERAIAEASAKQEATYTVADIGGPGLGGILIRLLTAPFAILADVASYVVAGALITSIRLREPAPAREQTAARRSLEMLRGLTFTLRNPVLRPMAVQSLAFSVLGRVVYILYLPYGVVELHMSAGLLGLSLASGGVGGLAGTLTANRVARLGTGRAIVWSMALACVPLGLIPLASGPTWLAIPVMFTGFVLAGLGLAVFNVLCIAVRVTLAPPDRLASTIGGYQQISNGGIPLAGLAASLLAAIFGVRAGMGIAIAILTVCVGAFLCSGVRRLDMPPGGRQARPKTAGE